jgi:hypothetical protein
VWVISECQRVVVGEDSYVCAKLDQTPTVWPQPESHEDDNRLCNYFLGQAQKYTRGLGEACACEADGVFEVGWDAIEVRSRAFKMGYGRQ